MGICKNQFEFVKKYGLDYLKPDNNNMLELGDQVLNNHDNYFNGLKTGKQLYTQMGYQHTSFDLNGNNGAIKVDLGRLNTKYNNVFDIITNHGTSEHVKNAQYTLFKNLHNWGKVGCIYTHNVPLESNEHESYLKYSFPPHGDYEYSSAFWKELCDKNKYEIFISQGNLVSNLALNYPKNYYSSSAYRKIEDSEFMNENDFNEIFKKYCKNTTYRLGRKEHLIWKNSLPENVKSKYPGLR